MDSKRVLRLLGIISSLIIAALLLCVMVGSPVWRLPIWILACAVVLQFGFALAKGTSPGGVQWTTALKAQSLCGIVLAVFYALWVALGAAGSVRGPAPYEAARQRFIDPAIRQRVEYIARLTIAAELTGVLHDSREGPCPIRS